MDEPRDGCARDDVSVFLVLDQFNPMMNFVDNSVSRWLLAALCLCAIARSVLGWRRESADERVNHEPI